MFYLVCLVFQGLVYAFRIHQDIAKKWFYFWSQCWIECSNGSEGFVRTTITFPCLWNCSHTFLAKYVCAICNIKFDISFSCIREQHIATITMNPKRVHFCSGPGFSNSLLGILRNRWVSSDVVSDVYSFAKKVQNDYETQTTLPGTMTKLNLKSKWLNVLNLKAPFSEPKSAKKRPWFFFKKAPLINPKTPQFQKSGNLE